MNLTNSPLPRDAISMKTNADGLYWLSCKVNQNEDRVPSASQVKTERTVVQRQVP
jgi:hypothetical protein